MQQRMKNFQLTKEHIDNLFKRIQVGVLATQTPDGFPYATPVNFVYQNDKIYMHGLPKGQKIDNILQNPKVGFEIHEMIGLLYDGIDMACDTNVEYNSVIVLGYAKIIKDLEVRREVLNKIVDKYTPQFSGRILPENMVKGTTVIEVEIKECTGKYYK